MTRFPPRRRLLNTTAQRVLLHVSERTGVSVERMHQHTRARDEIAARKRAARILRRLGYGLPDIAIAMQRHHTTVLHHVGGQAR